MSSDLVDHIHLRLKEELARCEVTLASASRRIGESSPQRLKDVVSGRQKCPADLVARLITVGIDALYVLTGTAAPKKEDPLAPDEAVLLQSYRALKPSERHGALIQIMRAGSTLQRDGASTQTVSGSNNRVAGRDYLSKE